MAHRLALAVRGAVTLVLVCVRVTSQLDLLRRLASRTHVTVRGNGAWVYVWFLACI